MTTGPAAASPTAEIARLIDEALKRGEGLKGETLEKVVQELTRLYSIKPDEVAILEVSPKGDQLGFVYPAKLQNVGSIPMSSTNSLAVRTIRDKRPEMINNFPAQKHPTVFEAVELGEATKERKQIQKIMSVPLLVDGRAVGVLQVSRKGKTAITAGGDFTIRDLTTLVSTAGVIAKSLKK